MDTSKLIWIFLSTDHVITLLQYDTRGGQLVELKRNLDIS